MEARRQTWYLAYGVGCVRMCNVVCKWQERRIFCRHVRKHLCQQLWLSLFFIILSIYFPFYIFFSRDIKPSVWRWGDSSLAFCFSVFFVMSILLPFLYHLLVAFPSVLTFRFFSILFSASPPFETLQEKGSLESSHFLWFLSGGERGTGGAVAWSISGTFAGGFFYSPRSSESNGLDGGCFGNHVSCVSSTRWFSCISARLLFFWNSFLVSL